MSGLSISDLFKGYASTPVLRGVDLEVEDGTVTAVLGLSGCGKTTLLRVVAGLERAQKGSIALGERTLDDAERFVAPERRGIGYVPQEGALFPHLTVQGNVAFGLPRRERGSRAVGDLLEMVSLTHLARRFPHQLSGGEQQRVALARALARKPHVLLLDEPFSSLDAALRASVREEVSALLRSSGATTVLVTHDQEEALSLADTVAVLRDGVIVQSGTPADLYGNPADAALAGFLGAVNMVPASFHDGAAQTPLGTLALRAAPPSGGDVGTVMVRPEQLSVTGGLTGGGLTGEVTECRYYGHDALLYIRPAEPSLEGPLIARVPGEGALAPGTRVSVTAHGSVRALP